MITKMAKRKMERQAFCTRLFVYARKRFLFSGGSCESVSIQAPSPTPSQKMSPLAKILFGDICKHFQNISKHSPKDFQTFSKIFAPPLQKCCPRVSPYTQTFSWCQPGKSKNLAYQTTFFLYFHNFHACFLFSLRETVAFHISLLSREFCFLRFLFPVRAL